MLTSPVSLACYYTTTQYSGRAKFKVTLARDNEQIVHFVPFITDTITRVKLYLVGKPFTIIYHLHAMIT